jgi:hypothetical protein
MLRKIKNIPANLKNWIHDKLIAKLVKDHVFSLGDINLTRKEIYTGLYGMKLVFLEPKHELILAILQKHYGYKFTQLTMVFTSNNK